MRLFITVSREYKLIGGWSSSDVGESYGDGFQLSNVKNWMNKLLISNS